MTIVMHDLAGAHPTLRFSPYCWRIRMALAPDDPIAGWRERMLDLFDGLARKAPTV